MTSEEILEGLERLGPWFHKIDLGDGLTTTDRTTADDHDHPQSTWKIIQRCLPSDLRGKSVLDVGCNAGFYSIEAKKRGASKVLGLDAQRHHVQQARFVARALGMDIKFDRSSVYDLDPRRIGQFDVTLALGLIYHCKHLVMALEKLFLITKGLLILETAIIAQKKEGRTLRSFMRRIESETPNLHPLAYLENSPHSKEPVYNWFYPSVNCLKALLRDVGFSDIEVFNVTSKGRAVLLCRKDTEYADSFFLSYLASELTLESGERTCSANAELRFEIRARNIGLARWLATGEDSTDRGAVHLTAHLLNNEGDEIFRYRAGARLSRDLAPGESELLEIALRAPDKPGNYILEFDMLVEHLAWFDDLGSPTLRHELRVEK